MAVADEFRDLAEELRRGKTEGAWRRSISTSYYASFHRIVDDSLALVVAAGVPTSFYSRSITHKQLLSCAKAFSQPNNLAQSFGFDGRVDPDVVVVASKIAFLYGMRITADYKVVGVAVTQTTANDCYDSAKDLFRAASALTVARNSGYVSLLAGVLLREPVKD